MTKSQINVLKRLIKNDRRAHIIDYGGKEVLISSYIAVITMENISGYLEEDLENNKSTENLIDDLIRPCYSSHLILSQFVPEVDLFLKHARMTHDKQPLIWDFGPGLPAVQAKLLKDCISLIGSKTWVSIAINPDKPLLSPMLVHSSEKPQTMCLLMPVKKRDEIIRTEAHIE